MPYTEFTERLTQSHSGVVRLAKKLAPELGKSISVPQLKIRGRDDSISHARDRGDLLIGSLVIEVKVRKFNFANFLSHGEIFVYAKQAWEAKAQKPSLIFLESKNGELFGCIPEKNWRLRRTKDPLRKYPYEVYVTEKGNLLSWSASLNYLRNLLGE